MLLRTTGSYNYNFYSLGTMQCELLRDKIKYAFGVVLCQKSLQNFLVAEKCIYLFQRILRTEMLTRTFLLKSGNETGQP